jgi:hypothetical protein
MSFNPADAAGQRVRTAFGDGTILAFLEGDDSVGARYRVRFPFGIGFVRAYAIMHGIHVDGTKYVRRDGQMEKEDESTDGNEWGAQGPAKLDKKFKVLFGSDCIYLFLRLYSYLVSLLDEIDSFLRANPTMVDPTSNYYNPMKSHDEKNDVRLDFAAVMTNLQKVIGRKMSSKDFEAFCRRVSPEIVHKMAALPKLVEKCADMMAQTAKEDLLLQLFDFCNIPAAVSLQQRFLLFAGRTIFIHQQQLTIQMFPFFSGSCSSTGGMSIPVFGGGISHSIQFYKWKTLLLVCTRRRGVVNSTYWR